MKYFIISLFFAILLLSVESRKVQICTSDKYCPPGKKCMENGICEGWLRRLPPSRNPWFCNESDECILSDICVNHKCIRFPFPDKK